MIPAFVIHHPSTKEREDIVADIVAKTNAMIVEAILRPIGAEGCTMSHLKVAALAKELYPHSDYLVFEDDCILMDDWDTTIEYSTDDVYYLGYNDECEHTTFGTHAMKISPKARNRFLESAIRIGQAIPAPHTMATDWIWSRVSQEYGLQVCKPYYPRRQDFCYQKKGLKSIITGKIRL